jgi:hypothetical protein
MNTKVLSKKEFGNSVQTTIQLNKNDKSNISIDEIGQIINRFKQGGARILVRALNIERWMTIKGFDEEFDEESFVEYYANKVEEEAVEKFTSFPQVQISVIKIKNN